MSERRIYARILKERKLNNTVSTKIDKFNNILRQLGGKLETVNVKNKKLYIKDCIEENYLHDRSDDESTASSYDISDLIVTSSALLNDNVR